MKKLKFGTSLPWLSTGKAFQAEEVLTVAKAAEEGGFDSIWAGDHLLHFPVYRVPESWTLLTASSMVTDKVLLGTCVTDPHRYHPAVMAQRLATIDHFSSGRVIFGLGGGVAINLEKFNIEWKKPVSKLVEYVDIMRKLWSGETFSYDGEFWQFDDAFLQIKPVRDSVPIYLAANSPRTTRLAGEIADGWLPLGLTVEMYKKRLKTIRDVAKKSGRNPNDIDAGLYICTSVADRAEDAYVFLDMVKVLLTPNVLREAGYEIEFPKELRSYTYLDWKPTMEYMSVIEEYSKYVPREAVMDFNLGGTVGDCIERIDEFIKAGVKHFVFEIMGSDHHEIVKQIGEEILPHFEE